MREGGIEVDFDVEATPALDLDRGFGPVARGVAAKRVGPKELSPYACRFGAPKLTGAETLLTRSGVDNTAGGGERLAHCSRARPRGVAVPGQVFEGALFVELDVKVVDVRVAAGVGAHARAGGAGCGPDGVVEDDALHPEDLRVGHQPGSDGVAGAVVGVTANGGDHDVEGASDAVDGHRVGPRDHAAAVDADAVDLREPSHQYISEGAGTRGGGSGAVDAFVPGGGAVVVDVLLIAHSDDSVDGSPGTRSGQRLTMASLTRGGFGVAVVVAVVVAGHGPAGGADQSECEGGAAHHHPPVVPWDFCFCVRRSTDEG